MLGLRAASIGATSLFSAWWEAICGVRGMICYALEPWRPHLHVRGISSPVLSASRVGKPQFKRSISEICSHVLHSTWVLYHTKIIEEISQSQGWKAPTCADGSWQEESSEGWGPQGVHHPSTQETSHSGFQEEGSSGCKGDQEICTEGYEDHRRASGC